MLLHDSGKGEGTYHDQTRSEQIIPSHPLQDIIVALLPW